MCTYDLTSRQDVAAFARANIRRLPQHWPFDEVVDDLRFWCRTAQTDLQTVCDCQLVATARPIWYEYVGAGTDLLSLGGRPVLELLVVTLGGTRVRRAEPGRPGYLLTAEAGWLSLTDGLVFPRAAEVRVLARMGWDPSSNDPERQRHCATLRRLCLVLGMHYLTDQRHGAWPDEVAEGIRPYRERPYQNLYPWLPIVAGDAPKDTTPAVTAASAV